MSIRLKSPCPNSRYRPKLLLRLFHFSSWQKVYEPPTKLTIANSLTKQQPLIGNGGVGIERDKASKTLSVLPPLGENIYTTPSCIGPSFVSRTILYSLYLRTGRKVVWVDQTRYPNWGFCNNSVKRVFQLDIFKPYKKPMKCKVLQIRSVWEHRFVAKR